MDKVYFTKEEFNKLWNKLEFLEKGGEGICKRLNNKEIIKYLDSPYANLDGEKILKFKEFKSKTYLFPYKVFYIDDKLMGYITKYSRGKNLIEVPRDTIRFDKFISGVKKVENDCNILSQKGIMTFDILFNILYKNGVFYIIDTCDYEIVDKDCKELYKDNISYFNYSLLEFLVKDRFYKFVFTSKELSELYKEAENGESIILFLKTLRQRLSEYCDKDVKVVRDAKKAMTLCHKSVYPEYF